MKKLITLILTVNVLLWSVVVNADDSYLKEFNKFLSTKGVGKEINICKEEKKYSKKWFDAGCELRPGGVFIFQNGLKIKFYKDRSSIPWDGKPNYDTMLYYGFFYLEDNKGFSKIGVDASQKPYVFDKDIREDKNVKKQLEKTGMLSYLLYEDGKIVVDQKTPVDRFGIIFDDDTLWTSASMGKTMVSYVTGHAVCEGYINSVDQKLNDWPLLENTVYYNQKLSDMLNMAAGDQKYSNTSLTKNSNGDIKWSKNPNNNTIKFHMQNGIMVNTKSGANKYNYSNLVPNTVISYVHYKAGADNFQKLLNKIFIEKAQVENEVYFVVMNSDSVKGAWNEKTKRWSRYDVNIDTDGAIRYSFRASRYDYLRIAKAMLDDWNNDTCEGKYLKSLYENRINKNNKYSNNKGSYFGSKGYAGFFHTNYPGSKKDVIMGMNGYGGQEILINFTDNKIVSVNAIHDNYNWSKIVLSAIKN